MAFPTTGILDDFNRADENPVNTNWGEPVRSGTANLKIVSLRALGETASVDNESYWDITTFGANQEAWVKIPTYPAAGDGTNLYVRLTAPGGGLQNCYLLNVAPVVGGANDSWTIYKSVAGVFTSIATATQEFAAGHGLGLEVIGTAIKGYHFNGTSWNQTPIISVTNGDVTGTGKIALGTFGTSARYTPFGGGTVVVGVRQQGLLLLGVGA